MIGIGLLVVGLIAIVLFGLFIGGLIILIGILLGTVGAGHKTVMVCPKCKKIGSSLGAGV